MLKGDGDTYIYIIDKNYKILYCNDNALQKFPCVKVGELCYHAVRDEKKPCHDCPLQLNSNSTRPIFYNRKINQWQEINSAIIDWLNYKDVNLIMIRDIQEEDKNLFYNFTNLNAYDELFELNITRNLYKILYHVPNKYIIPPTEGKINTMINQIIDEEMIHPDDHDNFLNFWDLPKLHETFSSNQHQILKGYFRKKKTDGKYCWVLQTVVAIENSQMNDEIIMCFIQEINEPPTFQQLPDKKQFNELTGLYQTNSFFQIADNLLKTDTSHQYCMVAIDIEHFKLFNEWYGIAAGDLFLRAIAKELKTISQQLRGIAGYLLGDDFALLIPYHNNHTKMILDKLMHYIEEFQDKIGFYPALGVCLVDDRNMPSQTIYDRAVIALTSIKGNYAKRIAYYQDKMQLQMEEEHKLLLDFQNAIENNEFTFYAQPKCNIQTGKIVGTEALVRWQHPKKGIIPPNEFIPILEKNGLIGKMDYYIWDCVYKHLRKWIDNGHKAIPISVNVSRIDMFTLDVVKCFKDLVNKYQINHNLIEIEITESAYVEEYDKVKTIIKELRQEGFLVSMDDFGSGYSSLNMLKDINVDVLKIDMNFLNMNEQSSDKGIGILEAIINMAKLMGLRVIAEGIESSQQVELLLDLGCLYAQGYYFYKPMTSKQFEAIIKNDDKVDYRGIQAKQINYISIKTLVDHHVLSDAMLNNILGGIAFFEFDGHNIELLNVNQNYCKIVDESGVDVEEKRLKILENIYEPDQTIFLDLFEQATVHLINGTKGQIRYLTAKGTYKWLNIYLFLLKKLDHSNLYYAQVSDITEQKKKEKQLESSQKALAAAVHISENDDSFMNLAEENKALASSIFSQMSPGGMIGGYCEDGFPLFFANDALVKLLGYETYEEFAIAIKEQVINTIHPDDREQVAKDIGSNYYSGLEYTTTYRMPKKDGTWFWTLDKGKVIETEDGRLAIVSACIDISETIAAQQKLAKHNETLQKVNQELYYLNNKLPGGYHRCADTPDYDFIHISNRFLEFFNYTRQEIKELFNDKFINMIHPDDRAKAVRTTENLSQQDESFDLEYRMLAKDGYIWVIDQTSVLEYNGTRFFQGVVTNVTKNIELRNQMQLLEKYSPVDIVLITCRKNNVKHTIITNGLISKYGYNKEQYQRYLDNKEFEYNFNRDAFKIFEQNIIKAFKQQTDYYEILSININSKTVWFKTSFEFVKADAEEIQYLYISSDITSFKEKEYH